MDVAADASGQVRWDDPEERWQVLQAARSRRAEASTDVDAGHVGAGNTRHAATSGRCAATGGAHRATAYEAGIDTVRVLYRVKSERAQRHAESLCAAGSSDLGSMKMRYAPALELLTVDGRAAPMLDHPGLLQGDLVPDVCEAIEMKLADHGLADVAEVGLSRVDATVSLDMGTPAEGWALLQGLYALDVPRRKPELIGRPLETVYWLSPRGEMKERAYDKGLQLGDAQRGVHIRLEAQMRFPTRSRTTGTWWTMERVREGFEGRFATMARSAEGVRVASETVLRQQLRAFADEGKITPRVAEILMGHLAAESVGLRRPGRTQRRHRAELRRLGLAQALDGVNDDQVLDVDLPAVLAEALTTPRWTT